MTTVGPGDIVARAQDVVRGARPPLLVIEPLRDLLDRHDLGAGELHVAPLGNGHSNVTYLVVREGARLVVRRPPRPPLPPSAHDVLREAQLLRALAGTRVRVPQVLAVCDDTSLIGAPFYVMEHMPGGVVGASMPAALDNPHQRARLAEELIDTLAELHAVDWQAAGLADFGRPSGYLARQVRRFSGLWEFNRTREVEQVERIGAWLAEHIPSKRSGPPTIVHGDYRLGNMLFASAAPARLTAVLDWEMATLGEPLADLGYLLAMWVQDGDPEGGLRDALGQATRAEGFPTRAALADRYAQVSGRAAGDMRWYMALAAWKAAVFMEGNYRRALAGATDDPYLRDVGDVVIELADWAAELAFAPVC